MRTTKTARNFGLIEFKDYYEQECSIQKSSLATLDALWIGVDNTGRNLDSKNVNARMHLSRKQVKAMLPVLQHFADTGELPTRYRKL